MLYVQFEPVDDPRGAQRRTMIGKVRVEDTWIDLNDFLKHYRLIRVELTAPNEGGIVTGGIEVEEEDEGQSAEITPHL